MPIIIAGSTPGAPAWELDPVSEDAANANLPLTGNYHVDTFSAPMPQPDVLYASSVDTEGELPASTRFRNRQISMVVAVDGAGALSDLEFKIAKLIREGGTLLYQTKGGEDIVFDILSVSSFDFPTNDLWLLGDQADCSFTLECTPLGRGPEIEV